jgi:hypothetical protein
MFATSMTSDPAQQSDQACILNEIMSRWQPILALATGPAFELRGAAGNPGESLPWASS